MTQATAPDVSSPVRLRLTVTGVVQGVGFRPFVYGLAHKHDLKGFVGNDSSGVFIEIEGTEADASAFHYNLQHSPPPLAHITEITTQKIVPRSASRFNIVTSQSQSQASTFIAPDMAVCDDCLHELFEPTDRRYGYPFINCTNCGPRFTIIKDMPYDRPLTTMADFVMCSVCQAEYDDPLDRRFHAQPNACSACGPQIWLEAAGNETEQCKNNPISETQYLFQQGQIVAVKGLGGFHLACDATHDAALARLRQRKGRVDKPFAVMAPDIATIKQFAHVSAAEERLLASQERPIVLLQKKRGTFNQLLSNLVAPGNSYIGVMLPYTPLHYLLFHSTSVTAPPCPVLVMTSANFSNEPIVKDNDEAQHRLSRLADAFLLHNRTIDSRCDDSILRIGQTTVNCDEPTIIPMRRSRGYAPFPVKLPYAVPPILAVGGELKATFCLAQDNFAYMSQHIGDMENLETLEAFTAAAAHFQTIFRIQPQRIACDMHPAYLATAWAQQQNLPVVMVQHHHAHIAAVMAEHQLPGDQPVIGFSFDGTGYGPDGAIWGGELLLADYRHYQRLSHLKYVPLASGNIAIKRPYRLALTHLAAANRDWSVELPPVIACPEAEQKILKQQLETGLNTVPTSSMGRLFDAVSALVGVRQTITYEGQAAIEFEALVARNITASYTFDLSQPGHFDAAPVIQAIVQDMQIGVNMTTIAAKFHNAVANLIVQLSLQIREKTDLNQVALSGGVFQNITLLEKAVDELQAHSFEVFTHRLVPANDGGLALGQAIIASAL